jgi:hypothetical protein
MNAEERVAAPDHNLIRDILLGSAAASIATCFSNPIEVCKTRLQLQGELQNRSVERLSRQYSNMFDAFYKIARNEGIRGLQGGLAAGIMFQSVMNGFRLGCYDFINTAIRSQDKNDPYFFVKNAAVAASVGGTGAFLANPFFLVKVRMQTLVRGGAAANTASSSSASAASPTVSAPVTGPRPATAAAGAVPGASVPATATASASATAHASASARGFSASASASASAPMPTRPIGIQYGYTSTFDAFRSIVRAEGLRGLMRGAGVASARVAVGSATQFTLYEAAKLAVQERTSLRGTALHFAASSLAAVAVTVAMNPFDVVTTRLYNTNKDAGVYSGAGDVVRKMFKTEGLRGLYKGLVPHYARLGPHMIIMFVAWEKLKMVFKPPRE